MDFAVAGLFVALLLVSSFALSVCMNMLADMIAGRI